ncbi:D-hexose-6-phosphate mutarotase [uncultured Sunxiuqinia sp.]|uniref:D-hexose-6-phosphate mutarotase n=1 Tax=uncultured Sunxiuqinia sp. TaxID=1573825 RepID=UPI0030D80F53
MKSMIDIDLLDEKYSIEGEIGFMEMEGELPFISVSNKYAQADICLYGAHVMSFTPHKTMELLWMSPTSFSEEGKAIRGGIPVCFPWFGPHPTDPKKPQHGFGRLIYWDVVETKSEANGETLIRFQLNASEETKAYWPHNFTAELAITVGTKLQLALKVTNSSQEAFEYSAALHSYFNVSGIENCTIEGLQGTKYFNQLTGDHEVQEEPVLKINEPVTRHYLDTETPVVIADPVFRRRILVEKAGSRVTTVWNPGEEATAGIPDIPDDGYHAFICVEATNAFNNCITLAPGKSHETTAIIGLEE